ncbi:fatty acid desaturase [Cesiribacter sp. SM1]|uniref:fatty acid desaturase n=1 Tax=Cesiribacter sp. SM1 TaxID=2861196 RepID=UPI001CD28B0E|nr:fatty acid desaturase [Cesiribacter sp. SM1]
MSVAVKSISFWQRQLGVSIALAIVAAWTLSLWFLLTQYTINWYSPLSWLLVLLQTHLYTGLFITAHDAMHGAVSKNKGLNNAIGWITALLFAYNWYPRLYPRHHLHHRFVATDHDPDYHHSDNFFLWYFSFLKQYVTIWQIVAMAITYNLLILIFPQQNVILFWMVPSILATLQLFYFGTYLPHKGEHAPDNRHKSGSQAKNHLWAFMSCYFFGYHWEHHHYPGTPWWQLWKKKA